MFGLKLNHVSERAHDGLLLHLQMNKLRSSKGAELFWRSIKLIFAPHIISWHENGVIIPRAWISRLFHIVNTWWRHQMETFSALLAICAANSPVIDEFLAQRPVTRRFDFYDLCLNKRLSKQSWGWRFETPSRPLWRHCNECSCWWPGNAGSQDILGGNGIDM